MGCLFALFAGVFPRLALLIVPSNGRRNVLNAAATRAGLAIQIIFLPFATLIYVILYTPGVGLTGFAWF
jgi:hypothetical protein